MRFTALVLLITLLTSFALQEATDATFNSAVKTGRSLVIFHSPHCGHCLRTMPTFKEACDKLSAESDVECVTLNVVENRKMSRKYHIYGIPSIRVFEDGEEVAEFEGKRTVDEFVRFAQI